MVVIAHSGDGRAGQHQKHFVVEPLQRALDVAGIELLACPQIGEALGQSRLPFDDLDHARDGDRLSGPRQAVAALHPLTGPDEPGARQFLKHLGKEVLRHPINGRHLAGRRSTFVLLRQMHQRNQGIVDFF